MDKCREEFEKHFLSLKFATEGVAQTVLDACTFDKDQNVYLPNMEWFLHNDDQEGAVYCSMLNTCYMSFQSRQTEVDELQNLYTQQGINMLKLQKRVDELEKSQNSLELRVEESECVSMCLDDRAVAKCDEGGNEYSLWGRVCQFKRVVNITEDDLERIYWEFDHERSKQGEERLRFKEALRGLLEQALKGEGK